MADDLSENQISLEELLEDVEFDCPGLTLNENSQDASVDTATQAQDSVDSADTTKASDLPEHTFVKKMIAGKTGEKLDTYNKVNKQSLELKRHSQDQPKVVSNNPLDNLDFTTPEFRAGVENLADKLKICKHPDHLVTLLAICNFVSTRLNPRALSDPSTVIPSGEPFPYKDTELGFDTGDKDVNEAAKILRLLHIQDLRSLQTKINECIVAIQTITANPKTDTRLGKVGR